jgi:hypothetical protein
VSTVLIAHDGQEQNPRWHIYIGTGDITVEGAYQDTLIMNIDDLLLGWFGISIFTFINHCFKKTKI